MKKLLVLVMVLAMASFASAALTLTISGPTELAYGAQGTYTVSYSGDSLSGVDMDIVSNAGTQAGMWNISGGVLLATPRVTSYDWTAKNTSTGNYEITMFNEFTGALTSPLFSFVFTAPAAGTSATISTIDNGSFLLNMDSASFNPPSMQVSLVPEPVTIALLGLGGLFLRRRIA